MRHVLAAIFDSAMGRMLSEVLKAEGYHVTRAQDQDQLIAVLRSTLHPLAVLLDMWAIAGGSTFIAQFLAALVAGTPTLGRARSFVPGGGGPLFSPPPPPPAQ